MALQHGCRFLADIDGQERVDAIGTRVEVRLDCRIVVETDAKFRRD